MSQTHHAYRARITRIRVCIPSTIVKVADVISSVFGISYFIADRAAGWVRMGTTVATNALGEGNVLRSSAG